MAKGSGRTLKSYFRTNNELSLESECLMRNNRLVMPQVVRNELPQTLHKSHLGVVKSKSLVRSYVWWPNLGNDIEIMCKTCENCSPHKSRQTKLFYFNPWPCQNAVWERIHLDFL